MEHGAEPETNRANAESPRRHGALSPLLLLPLAAGPALAPLLREEAAPREVLLLEREGKVEKDVVLVHDLEGTKREGGRE